MTPQLHTMLPQIAQGVRKKMAGDGVKGTKEEMDTHFSKGFNEAVSA